MKLRKAAFGALLGVLCCTTDAAQKPKSIDLWLNADITIDKTGHITALDWTDTQPGRQLVASRIAPRVQAWEFVPAMVEGQPNETRTALTIGTRVTEHDDGSATIQVTGAHTGPRTVSMTPPRYPQDAFRAGVDAIVKVDLEVGPDGKPVVMGMDFDSSSGKSGRKSYRKTFLEATQEAVLAWTFRPEVVAGHAVRTHMQVPVTFCIGPSPRCEQQPSAAQFPERPANMPIALDSAVAFKTDVRAANIP